MIVPETQGFYFFVKILFGSYLHIKGLNSPIKVKILRFYWEKICITCIFLLKACTFSVLKDFSVQNLKTTPRFIYLELLIIGVVF